MEYRFKYRYSMERDVMYLDFENIQYPLVSILIIGYVIYLIIIFKRRGKHGSK